MKIQNFIQYKSIDIIINLKFEEYFKNSILQGNTLIFCLFSMYKSLFYVITRV